MGLPWKTWVEFAVTVLATAILFFLLGFFWEGLVTFVRATRARISLGGWVSGDGAVAPTLAAAQVRVLRARQVLQRANESLAARIAEVGRLEAKIGVLPVNGGGGTANGAGGCAANGGAADEIVLQ